PAAAPSTAAGPPSFSSTAAASGPISVATESSRPRATFALVSSAGVPHSVGSSAEWAGRNSVCAVVAATSATYTNPTGPPAAASALAQARQPERPMPTHASTRWRGARSAITAANGAITADGTIRATPTSPTAATPPCRYASTPTATVAAHSLAQITPNAACARRRFGLRQFSAHAAAQSCALSTAPVNIGRVSTYGAV